SDCLALSVLWKRGEFTHGPRVGSGDLQERADVLQVPKQIVHFLTQDAVARAPRVEISLALGSQCDIGSTQENRFSLVGACLQEPFPLRKCLLNQCEETRRPPPGNLSRAALLSRSRPLAG